MGIKTKLKNLYTPSELWLPCRPTPSIDEQKKKSYMPFPSCAEGRHRYGQAMKPPVIDGTSQMHTLDEFLVCVERDLWETRTGLETAHTQLHKTEDGTGDYGRILHCPVRDARGKDRVPTMQQLEDTYIRGLPNSILQKVFTQNHTPQGIR